MELLGSCEQKLKLRFNLFVFVLFFVFPEVYLLRCGLAPEWEISHPGGALEGCPQSFNFSGSSSLVGPDRQAVSYRWNDPSTVSHYYYSTREAEVHSRECMGRRKASCGRWSFWLRLVSTAALASNEQQARMAILPAS